ncbi:hypothetical protein HYH03_007934 [Edaphochlamys debaryana]|uniref:Uncharacterized protein n=1 Tax=Edaphochlamys debaryana TaxID=47281 RepID=A0A836BZJ3_9CHLO|nr:hypothetical protein HYH03_007934 [Edaphochlamys debaryana]|eukprot:KAG2494007.1 hypothetical protein HYH03_007934 [Edaphochlamys debaryana]
MLDSSILIGTALEAELRASLAKALEQECAQKPVLVWKGLTEEEALAFVEKVESQRAFFFVRTSVGNGVAVGDLYVFKDPSRPHDYASGAATGELRDWLWPFARRLVRMGGTARLLVSTGFREPDSSLYIRFQDKPNVIVETAYTEGRKSLEESMALWCGPHGPAKVAIGIDVQYCPPQPLAPRVEVLMQLEGEQRPSVLVSCGAGSGCRSPAMYEHTLFVPLRLVLYGTPWLTQMLIAAWLAVVIPVYSITWGAFYAVQDVLCGRRSVLSLAGACVRSLRGPWWGMVPVDTFEIRSAVFEGLGLKPLLQQA